MPRIPTTEFIDNPKRYGYDVRVDKLLLRTAIGPNNPMTIQSSDVQAGQNINVKQNAEDFTSNLGRIYSRTNFSAGQGLDTAHRRDAQENDVHRFWDSQGVDVFQNNDDTSYNIHLLYTTDDKNVKGGSTPFSASNNYITQTNNGHLWVTDAAALYKSTDYIC